MEVEECQFRLELGCCILSKLFTNCNFWVTLNYDNTQAILEVSDPIYNTSTAITFQSIFTTFYFAITQEVGGNADI